MIKDDLGVFLVNIAKIYPIDDNKRDFDEVIKQTLEYLFDYTKGKDIDLLEAKKYVFDNYNYKPFPEPAFLKEALLKNIKVAEAPNEPKEYRLMLLILPDGYIYDFWIDDDYSNKHIEKFRAEKIKKHGDGTQVNVYPKGSTLLGKKVFIPIKPTKEGEEEKNKIVELGV